ncbi:family 43 glycosylhydrolase [Fodinicola acaciae]|uniref:family 43 glycosylhydrolase n=1 Tax=Fodinicola acaciae TaxID=2681555 RepID=UPI0013D4B79D|nr:family 43 glycosylhydrolase [Fodinicola acaciae]
MRRVRMLVAALIAVMVCVASVGPAGASPAGGTFRNPIKLNAPDPQIVYTGGYYYLTYTQGDVITLTRARSVKGLATATPTKVWDGASGAAMGACCDIWAPELHQIGNRWYIYYTADASSGDFGSHNMYVLQSAGSDPLGPYTNHQLTSDGAFSIDGTVLQQPNGSLYLIWSRIPPGDPNNEQDIVIAPMSDPVTVSGPFATLSRPTNTWEQSRGWVNEGPTVLQHGGKTYIVFSVSGCASPDYGLAMLTLTGGDVLDPAAWTKSSSKVFARADDNWVYGPGHNSFFTSPDGTEVWNVYHAVGNSAGSCDDDRSARIQRVNFRADGTPDFGIPAATWQTLALPSGDPDLATVPTGTYRLTPQHDTGRALDVGGCVTTPNATVDTYNYWGGACQKWNITPATGGAYKITAVNSGLALEVLGCNPARASQVDVYPYRSGDACQQWYLDPVGDGSYRISQQSTGQALDVGGCTKNEVNPVDIWPYWATGYGTCQQWRLDPV